MEPARADVGIGLRGLVPGTSSNFTVVELTPLQNRGMNAALTLFDHFVYVGSRTDGSSRCGGTPEGRAT